MNTIISKYTRSSWPTSTATPVSDKELYSASSSTKTTSKSRSIAWSSLLPGRGNGSEIAEVYLLFSVWIINSPVDDRYGPHDDAAKKKKCHPEVHEEPSPGKICNSLTPTASHPKTAPIPSPSNRSNLVQTITNHNLMLDSIVASKQPRTSASLAKIYLELMFSDGLLTTASRRHPQKPIR